MKKSYYLLLFLFLTACDGSETIQKHPTLVNRYDPSMPNTVDCIKPTYGGIDEPELKIIDVFISKCINITNTS